MEPNSEDLDVRALYLCDLSRLRVLVGGLVEGAIEEGEFDQEVADSAAVNQVVAGIPP